MRNIDAVDTPAIGARAIPADDRFANLPLVVSLFPTAFPTGPAYGIAERTTWSAFAARFRERREGEKDGPSFIRRS